MSEKAIRYIVYVLAFTVTFIVTLFLMLVGMKSVGAESAYPGPYPGPYMPLVVNEWDRGQPTPTSLPMPTSTPVVPPEETPTACDQCWECVQLDCYQFCLGECDCFFNDDGDWCVPCPECESGYRCRNWSTNSE